MIIVDLKDLEDRAQTALESIGGVMLEPEALLLIISEIRRLKTQLGEQHDNLSGMRNELLELRTELTSAHPGNQATVAAKPSRKTKLTMKVVAKDPKELEGAVR